MYTEEDEFNYDDYIEDDERKDYNKPFIDVRFILRIILIILLIILIIFLVFKIKNTRVQKSNNKKTDSIPDASLVFDNNMNMITNAAYDYFFKDNNLPEKVGDIRYVTIKKLIDNKYISKVTDSKGYVCGYNTSGATLFKNKNNYKMEIKLNCSEKSDVVVYYYDLDGKCLNCNGENYNPEEDTETKEESKQETKQETKEETKQEESFEDDKKDKVPSETEKVCKDFSSWSTVYVAGNNYEVQTRTLVKGYKDEVVYGEWSEPLTTKIYSTDMIDVKSYTETETVEKKTKWSSESTSKPKSKEGREISSRTVNKSYKATSCTEGKTYTRVLTKWDNSAYKCVTLSLGKVKCTYKTDKTCKTVTKYKKVKYYKYRDTITEDVETTYYQYRTIDKNTVYTDYILESEMPEGYTKLPGSEITQYRYREKCSK